MPAISTNPNDPNAPAPKVTSSNPPQNRNFTAGARGKKLASFVNKQVAGKEIPKKEVPKKKKFGKTYVGNTNPNQKPKKRGNKMLSECRKLQKDPSLFIQKAVFQRCVKMNKSQVEGWNTNLKMQAAGVGLLHHVVEQVLVDHNLLSLKLMFHSNRKTLSAKDMSLATSIAEDHTEHLTKSS